MSTMPTEAERGISSLIEAIHVASHTQIKYVTEAIKESADYQLKSQDHATTRMTQLLDRIQDKQSKSADKIANEIQRVEVMLSKLIDVLGLQTKQLTSTMQLQTEEFGVVTSKHMAHLTETTKMTAAGLQEAMSEQTTKLSTVLRVAADTQTTLLTTMAETTVAGLEAAIGGQTIELRSAFEEGVGTHTTILSTAVEKTATGLQATMGLQISNLRSAFLEATGEQTAHLTATAEKTVAGFEAAIGVQTAKLSTAFLETAGKQTSPLTATTMETAEGLQAAIGSQTSNLRSVILEATGEQIVHLTATAEKTAAGLEAAIVEQTTKLSSTFREMAGELARNLNATAEKSAAGPDVPMRAQTTGLTSSFGEVVRDQTTLLAGAAMTLETGFLTATEALKAAMQEQVASLAEAVMERVDVSLEGVVAGVGEAIAAYSVAVMPPSSADLTDAMKAHMVQLQAVNISQTSTVVSAIQTQTGVLIRASSTQMGELATLIGVGYQYPKTVTTSVTPTDFEVELTAGDPSHLHSPVEYISLSGPVTNLAAVLREVIAGQTQELKATADEQWGKIQTAIGQQTIDLQTSATGQTTKINEIMEAEIGGLKASIIRQLELLTTATGAQTVLLNEVRAAPMSQAQAEQIVQIARAEAEVTAHAIGVQTTELEKQGQVISAFTVLTTLFLPLGFCASVGPLNATGIVYWLTKAPRAQYFGAMNNDGFLNSKAHHVQFWQWSGGFTAVVVVITICVVWRSRALIKFEKPIRDNFARARDRFATLWGGVQNSPQDNGHSSIRLPPAGGDLTTVISMHTLPRVSTDFGTRSEVGLDVV